MRYLFIAAALLLTVSCKPKKNTSQTLDFGVFKLTTPDGWTIIKKQGIDSYYGGLTNGNDSLWFDYGLYSVDFLDESADKHHYAVDTVNGLPARITKSDTAGKGYVAIYIPRVTKKNKFTMWGVNVEQTDVVLAIYKSIVFEKSDTSINPQLTASNFIYPVKGGGKTLYMQLCASCHAMNKDLTGPAFITVVQHRTKDWLYTFITDRKKITKDSLSLALTKSYDTECMEFGNLSRQDVDLLFDYMSNY